MLIQNFRFYWFKTGDVIFDYGDQLDPGIYIILFGSVALIWNKKSYVVWFNWVFGEDCILKSFAERKYKAVAWEDTKLLRIELSELKKLDIIYEEEVRDI